MNPARQFQMEMALENAGAEFARQAFEYLRQFAETHEFFVSEDVSDRWLAEGRPAPSTLRAFGAIYRKAQRVGVIEMDGHGMSRRRSSICPRWKSLVFRRQAA